MPDIITTVVVDERSAAFIAMGKALQSGRPVAVVCTSGSALLNIAPAASEAYYRHIPLIIISADRPKEWIDQDDSQTIRQPGALAAVVKGSFNLSDEPATDRLRFRYHERQVNDASSTWRSARRAAPCISMSNSTLRFKAWPTMLHVPAGCRWCVLSNGCRRPMRRRSLRRHAVATCLLWPVLWNRIKKSTGPSTSSPTR